MPPAHAASGSWLSVSTSRPSSQISAVRKTRRSFSFSDTCWGRLTSPGYPLYSWLSHLFVTTLRIGTVAYRANLFSAVMAALACGVAFVLARQIGARRWAAMGAAVALASGASFWRSAVFAEVYSLAAVVVGATVSLLLAWDSRPRAGFLLAATSAFALGLGNHLTIIGLIPASVLYVVIRNRRVLTPTCHRRGRVAARAWSRHSTG